MSAVSKTYTQRTSNFPASNITWNCLCSDKYFHILNILQVLYRQHFSMFNFYRVFFHDPKIPHIVLVTDSVLL